MASQGSPVGREDAPSPLPCSFCGSILYGIGYGPGSARKVACLSCGAMGPGAFGEASAIEAWNRREPLAEIEASFKEILALREELPDAPTPEMGDAFITKHSTGGGMPTGGLWTKNPDYYVEMWFNYAGFCESYQDMLRAEQGDDK